MSFILVPKVGNDVQINGWNWRPTLALLHAAGLLSEEEFERMGANGCGGVADSQKAARIVAVLDAQLAKMKKGDRMRDDLTVTALPKSVDLKSDANDLYSASFEWLCRFRDFCETSGGFKVV